MDGNRIYNMLHLSARIYGLIWAARPKLETGLFKALAGPGKIKRRIKADQREAVKAELPILVLIMVLQAAEKKLADLTPEEMEFLKSGLVHFFSTNYLPLYLELKDPVKETMARVDWYMDGQEGGLEELFSKFVFSVVSDPKGELADPLHRFVTETVTAEIDRAIDLAPRYHI